ncbi:YceI family protein [Paraglaciecola marina]|uniref:YceI family protein n=1 Tax=Paraglaciecola marina TaxID=2500157 RepID=UPI00106238F9|nr:YceI family protein [Paraglaciecola marina]
MKSKILSSAFISLSLICGSANANWKLVEDESSVNFVSTKNQHISEVQKFTKLDGEFGSDGKLAIDIDLASIDSGIEIRDTRMREKLFMVDKFPTAKLIAQLPKAVLALPKGETRLVSLPATLSLFGHSNEIQVSVQVTRKADNGIVATSTKPILISAKDYDLAPGIEVLQKLAGLSGIGLTVPVTFNLVFKSN